MAELEYIIVVKDSTVWETSLWDELTKDGLGDDFIPTRGVTVINERPFNTKLAHFSLTAEEAAEIAKDDRIESIELNPELNDEIEFGFSGLRGVRTYNRELFNTADNHTNWGLARCISETNQFNNATVEVAQQYPFNLDGTGVDLIVVDSGVEENHPEFAVNADGTGGSRVVDFDWSTLNVPGCPTGPSIGGYLGDSDGHGTNCASIAAGNTQGWASGAAIYSLRIFSGNDITSGTFLNVISTNIVWDIIKAFHDKKIADGNTRPTICTNSWGFRTSYNNITSITYRGVTTSATSRDTSKGMINFQHGVMVNSQSVSVANASSTGVIMVGAAGNYFHKSDVNGGLDYDNFYTSSTSGNVFYHKGSSPTNADEMICVGATASNDNFDTKVNFSETGPRVDIYAPGDGIMGGYANKSYNTAAVQDPRDSLYFLNKVSGTSQATPQVAGVMCLLAQADPTITKTQMLDLLNKYALVDVMDTGVNDTDYTNVTGLQGGPNVFLQNPFSSPNRGGITST